MMRRMKRREKPEAPDDHRLSLLLLLLGVLSDRIARLATPDPDSAIGDPDPPPVNLPANFSTLTSPYSFYFFDVDRNIGMRDGFIWNAHLRELPPMNNSWNNPRGSGRARGSEERKRRRGKSARLNKDKKSPKKK